MKEYYKHHAWGEEGFDWEGLNEAVELISYHLTKKGRMHVLAKEKWGHARVNAHRWDGTISDLIKPGRVNRLYWFELKYFAPVLSILFGKLVEKWQDWHYYKAYETACYRYPHLIQEILGDAEDTHLLMDLYIEFGLPCPWTSYKCEAGEHTPAKKLYGDEKYCSECFLNISELKDLGD